MKKKLFRSLVLFILVTSIQSDIPEKGFIEWRKIENANGYKLEIKNEKQEIVLDVITETNIYYPDLSKGKYEFRIAVLNYFKKPALYSYWNPLKVIVSKIPVLNENWKKTISGRKILLQGANFLENTRAIATDYNSKTFVLNTRLVNENKLELETTELKEGKYDLRLINPNNKVADFKSFLIILKNNYFTVLDNKDITISSLQNNKADINVDSSNDKMKVNIGPKSTDKLEINIENKSETTVSIDVENHAKGKVNLNVENKSPELINLNVTSTSKETLTVTLNDNSVGKIGVNVDEKSNEKVKVNRSDEAIDNFDITIENKKKEKLGVQIGKPPLKYTPSNEVFPKNYKSMSKVEFDLFISNLMKNCPSNIDVPNILIAECYDEHATLNLADKDRKILFNYLLLRDQNQNSIIRASKFFINNCQSDIRFVRETADEFLRMNKLSFEETFYLNKMISSFRNCQIPESQ
jgi:hypothetical protein